MIKCPESQACQGIQSPEGIFDKPRAFTCTPRF